VLTVLDHLSCNNRKKRVLSKSFEVAGFPVCVCVFCFKKKQKINKHTRTQIQNKNQLSSDFFGLCLFLKRKKTESFVKKKIFKQKRQTPPSGSWK